MARGMRDAKPRAKFVSITAAAAMSPRFRVAATTLGLCLLFPLGVWAGTGPDAGGADSASTATAPSATSTAPRTAANTVLDAAAETEKRVHRLLDRAEQHIREHGLAGVNDFSSDPQFVDNELYVFSLSRSGYILSSGGWSSTLVGQRVVDLTDDQGRPFFEQMLRQASTSDRGSVEYLWFNPVHGGKAPKITYFRVVDDVLIASGYAPDVATEEEAKALLERAVSEYFNDPVSALRKFRNRHGEYRNLDQYVFVLNKANRTVVWAPNNRELNGQPLDDVSDIKSKRFLAEMADSANRNTIQSIDYWWFSPVTNKVEQRRAFYQQVGDDVIAVSTFVLPASLP